MVLFHDRISTYLVMLNESFTTFAEVSIAYIQQPKARHRCPQCQPSCGLELGPRLLLFEHGFCYHPTLNLPCCSFWHVICKEYLIRSVNGVYRNPFATHLFGYLELGNFGSNPFTQILRSCLRALFQHQC